MQRRAFLSNLAGAATAPLFAQRRRRPNIIWMMADDLGLGDVGCYGQKAIQTPHIDSLAQQGMRCTQAYAGSCVCAPSRSVLMTGLHGGHTPIRSNPGGVPLLESERTVADLLRGAGYKNGLFGKWGLGDIGSSGVPWKHGFDEFFGFLHQAHAHFQYPRFLYQNDKEFPLPGNDKPGRQTYANDVINEKALEFVRRCQNDPFFLYLSWTLPHDEPHVPEDSLSLYRGKVPNGPLWRQAGGRLMEQREHGPAYAGMVSRIDRYVGQVLALLKERNLERDTLVFFTSDNGGIMAKFEQDWFRNMAGLRGQKGSLYEGGIRVPMLARFPGRIPPGQTSSHIWTFADFLPTAAEVAGVSAPAGLDGVSVTAALGGRKQTLKDYHYWEHLRYDGKTKSFRQEKPVQALRQGDWKILRPQPDGALELYNLREDPAEQNDLAAVETARRRALEKLLEQARTEPRPQAEQPHPWWDARS